MVASQSETYRVKRDVLRGRLALRAAAGRPVPAYPGLDLRAGARDTLLGAFDAGRELLYRRLADRRYPSTLASKEPTMTVVPSASSRGPRATPSSLGFRMPAEWEPHERCIMGWPTELRIDSVWGEHYLLAMASYAAVAHAIADFEPVMMIARPRRGSGRAQLPRPRHRGRRVAPRRLLAARQRADLRHAPGRDARHERLRLQLLGREVQAVRQRRCHRPAARRALQRGAVRHHGPRGRRHHRRRRGHVDHHRELPAPPVAQSQPHQGRDDASPQGLPRRREGHLAHLRAGTG